MLTKEYLPAFDGRFPWLPSTRLLLDEVATTSPEFLPETIRELALVPAADRYDFES